MVMFDTYSPSLLFCPAGFERFPRRHVKSLLLSRLVPDDLADYVVFVHYHASGRYREDPRQLGGDKDNRLTPLGKVGHEPVDFALRPDVDAPGGLVENQKLRLCGKPPGDQDLLLVSSDRNITSWSREGVLMDSCPMPLSQSLPTSSVVDKESL